jgi:hypothetical protein
MSGKKWIVSLIVLAVLALLAAAAVSAGSLAQPTEPQGLAPQAPIGSTFTYQGQLKRDGKPVTDDCDMVFRLYDENAPGGSQVGDTVTTTVPITAGLFAVQLDFGAAVFAGDARWLGIQVACPGDVGFADLGRQPLTPAPYALALPGLWTRQNETSPNLIGGYGGNVISETVVGATIGGGGAAGPVNRVTGDYGTVGGGKANTARGCSTVGGGSANTASGPYATVGGGYGNAASGTYSTVGGGEGNTANGSQRATVGGGGKNTASGTYSTVGGGASNSASGSYATVPGGWGAVASHYGEAAHANGWFVYPAAGQAQTSVYVLRRTTTSGAATELFLDGDTATERLTIASGRTATFDILVAARTETGASDGYHFLGIIENQAGVTSFVGTPQKTALSGGATAWDANIIADNANDALVVQVTGAAATTIRWVATVHTAEVAW